MDSLYFLLYKYPFTLDSSSSSSHLLPCISYDFYVMEMIRLSSRPAKRKREYPWGKSLAAIELGMASTRPAPVPESTPANGTATAGDPESENASFASAIGSPESIYRPEWGVANGSLLDTPEACQDLVDHVAPPGYFSELYYLHNDKFLRQYNVNLARQVAMGSQLRLRFEQEAKLLRKSVAQVAHRDKRIQAREHEIKNLEALLEVEADMKRAAEDKSVMLSQELEDMRAMFSDLQVSNNRLTQQVATLQEQISGEEKLKAAFEEFKWYGDSRVEQRCVEMDARLDALSIYFDEELYPHMLTVIAGRRWMIGHGAAPCRDKMRRILRVKACVCRCRVYRDCQRHERGGENQIYCGPSGIERSEVSFSGSTIGPERRPYGCDYSYPVRDPVSPWACKEEMLLMDTIADNVSRAKKKKKYRIVCRTHGVGSVHHAQSDGIPVSAPIVVPQGLALLLADAATQTDTD
nr:hypothetical protein [Tanacetum cinerariifolium]